MKIFISGSISINNLDKTVIEKLNSIMHNKHAVLMGDAFGVDINVQKYFYRNNYINIVIYYAGDKIRNNIGNWKTKQIINLNNLKGRELYTLKDIEMARDADFGFMIWDGKSKGTKNNIKNMLEQNKKFYIYINGKLYDTKSFDYKKYDIESESINVEKGQLALL
jgi:hypothetical protein